MCIRDSDDFEAAESDVGDETCPSKEAKTQTAYEKRIQKMFEKEKVAVEARKKIDDKLKASKGKPKRKARKPKQNARKPKRKGPRTNETTALGGLD